VAPAVAAREQRSVFGRDLESVEPRGSRSHRHTPPIARFLARPNKKPTMGARTINKHRQVIAFVSRHAMREPAFGLTASPAEVERPTSGPGPTAATSGPQGQTGIADGLRTTAWITVLGCRRQGVNFRPALTEEVRVHAEGDRRVRVSPLS